MALGRELDRYISGKRKRESFSSFKERVLNKKSALSNKMFDRLGAITQGGEAAKPDVPEDEGWKEVLLEGSAEPETVIDEPVIKQAQPAVNKEPVQRPTTQERNIPHTQPPARETNEETAEEIRESNKGRLEQLRIARKQERMGALRGKVFNILFKKKEKKEKDMAEQVRTEIRLQAKKEEASKRAIIPEKPKIVEHKKSFFSNFIEIKTAEEIAEDDKAAAMQEQAVANVEEINNLLSGQPGEIRTNCPAQNPLEFPELFPARKESAIEVGKVISLDNDYKIKVIRNN